MSEANSRPSGLRGRGASRGGGRGNFSTRGGRGGSRATNGVPKETTETTSLEEEGDIGELKVKYAAKIEPIKEMFPDWTEQDIAFALDETNGDLESTVERISEGTISQWGEVKKKTKDRSVSKAKDSGSTSIDAPAVGAGRGGRGRGASEATRGGRGRGADRGRGASRGARAAAVAAASANGSRSVKSTSGESSWVAPTPEPAAPAATGNWDTSTTTGDNTLESSWENVSAEAPQPAEPAKPASKPDGTRSWASMFAKPKPAPAPPKPSQHIPSHDPSIEISIPATYNQIATDIQGLPPPATLNETLEIPNTPPVSDLTPSDVPPSNDELTETNLEQVPDTSAPVTSATAASTTASTLDARNAGTPLGAPQNQPGSRPPLGGYATSAWKAAGASGRSASFQRKVLEQQEAVVMPGKHAVDRAAVQFGSMGLNGSPEDVDVDSDREDAETRAQPPQHSPVAPRAALPPAPQQKQPFPPHVQTTEPLPTPRQAPGLPPVGHSAPSQQQDLSPEEQELHAHPGSGQTGYSYNQFSDRYGTQVPNSQKPYEPFGQQASQPSQTEGLTTSSQSGQQASQGAFTGPNSDMSSFYTSDNPRNTYPNNFYSGYNQQSQPQNPDTGRTGSAFGTSGQVQASQYATSGQQQSQGRFGQPNEAQASGNSTPNPSIPSQQAQNQSHHLMGQQQQGQGHGGGQFGGYPGGYAHPFNAGYYSSYQMNQVSNHPYGRERPLFDDVRRYDDQYLTQPHQYGYGGNQAGYGNTPFGSASAKAAMYNQGHQGHQGYNQSPYDQHSASPANAGAFGSQLPSSGRDSAAAGGLGSYARSGSAQATDAPYSGSGAGSHSNVPDPFGGRAQSGYQGHNQGLGSGIGQGSNEDALRGYAGDSKVPGGPSPALGQPGGRPGSTQGQSTSGPGNYSGYPSHMNQGVHGQQGSQYSSGHGHQSGGQNHQTGGYGGYSAGYGGNFYGGSNRGGWGGGASYGH